MSLDLRDQLWERYGTRAPVSTDVQIDAGVADYVQGLKDAARERAFVLHADSGRTVITAPIREIARQNAGFTYLRGKFVQAEQANANGAMWTTEDLQLGGATIAGGPLNWLHDDTKIIGSLLGGEMVEDHIVADAAVWKFLFPEETRTIEQAAADGNLFYSMECVSRQVACIDSPNRPGCGESFSYADYDAGKGCTHLRERSSIRRFVDPIFLGGAVIVPPVLPGWSGATADVVRQAAELAEDPRVANHLSNVQTIALATAVLGWANRT